MTSNQGNIGPLKAVSGVPGTTVSPDWVATPPSSSGPVILNGRYTCRDSDRATWSQDSRSRGKRFCTVWVQQAIKG